MTPEIYVIILLCALMVIQQYFYMKQNQKLVDKLMSRNYGEYVTGENMLKPNETKVQLPPEDDQADPNVVNEIMSRVYG